MNKFGRWKGSLTVSVSGGNPERFFNLCSFHGIILYQMAAEDTGHRVEMTACDFFKARKLARKAGVRLKIMEKAGLPFFLRRSRKRLAFYVGILFCTAFLYLMSLFIWDIQVEGNTKYTDETLLQYLGSLGYVHGMKKKGIVCEEIEQKLRGQYPDITWVSAQITGNRLMIQIKENQVLEAGGEETPEKTGDITAKRGGTIVAMITRTGTPMVHVGDTVEAGQLLISGTLEIRDEGGNLLKTEEVQADGTVTARTVYHYEEVFSMSYPERLYTGKEKRRSYLWLFGTRLFLPGGKLKYAVCDAVDSYSQIHLWGNFYLPFGFGAITYREYQDTKAVYSRETARAEAERRFRLYCEQLADGGAALEDAASQISMDTDVCRVTGTVQVTEEIGTGK